MTGDQDRLHWLARETCAPRSHPTALHALQLSAQRHLGYGQPRTSGAAGEGMAATIADIAADAQISLGLAYRYVVDKEAIFAEPVKQTVPDDAAARNT